MTKREEKTVEVFEKDLIAEMQRQFHQHFVLYYIERKSKDKLLLSFLKWCDYCIYKGED